MEIIGNALQFLVALDPASVEAEEAGHLIEHAKDHLTREYKRLFKLNWHAEYKDADKIIMTTQNEIKRLWRTRGDLVGLNGPDEGAAFIQSVGRVLTLRSLV